MGKRGKKQRRPTRKKAGKNRIDAGKTKRLSPADQAVEQAKTAWAARRFDDALSFFQQALEHDPENALLLVDTGQAFALRYRFAEAESCLQQAAELYPNDPTVQVLLGRAFSLLNEFQQAIRCFRHALTFEQEPVDKAATLYELAVLLERLHQLDEARQCIKKALSLAPNQPQIQYLSALLDRREGHFDRATESFTRLGKNAAFPKQLRSDASYQLANIHDQQGRPAEALQAAERAKRILLSFSDGYQQQAKQIATVSDQTLRTIAQNHFARWQAAGDSLDRLRGEIAMLVGYPRSGTTLLEQVLDSHPKLVSADELTTFSELVYAKVHEQADDHLSDPELLDKLDIPSVTQLRNAYWNAMEGVLGQPLVDRMLLDKNPALTGLLPVIARVFPEAKIIVALRDPRDVVLSCFLQQLPLNPLSVHYLSLQATARHYAATMDLWLKIRPMLINPWLEVRYEQTVADLPGQARRVSDFLKLPWDDAVLEYRQHATAKHVHSPTYEAVTRPLYTSSIDRWKRYAEQLAPCLETLQPYVEAFGYEE